LALRSLVGRRKVLKAAVVSGAIAVLSGAVAFVRLRGYEEPSGPALLALSPAQYAIVQHLARRICAADEKGAPSPDHIGVARFVDRYVAEMPERLRGDLFRFFSYVEQLAPAVLGMASRFTRLSTRDQDDVLASIESSSSDLLRGGFESVKALVFMGYYRDPRTWSIASYDGPLLGRES
jgi:hypothetical protein